MCQETPPGEKEISRAVYIPGILWLPQILLNYYPLRFYFNILNCLISHRENIEIRYPYPTPQR